MSPNLLHLEDRDVDSALDRELRALLSTCFADPCFRERRHAHQPPRWRWILRTPDGRVAAHVAAHDRVVGTGDGPLRILGVAEVAVAPEHRRRGFVRQLLSCAHEDAIREGLRHALLFGLPEVYGSSGYRAVEAPIRRWSAAVGDWICAPMPTALARTLAPDVRWPDGPLDLAGPLF